MPNNASPVGLQSLVLHRAPVGPALMAVSLIVIAAIAQAATAPPPTRLVNPEAGRLPAGTPAPDGIGATMAPATTEGVYSTSTLTYVPWEDESVIKPLQPGKPMPAASVVQGADGKRFDLNAAVRSKPTLLIFYRGGWCPYCNAHLRELQNSVERLQAMGYQILAISTDTPEEVRKFNADRHLTYTLLSDTKLDVAAKFGLRYKVSKAYMDHVKTLPDGRATDMEAKNGGYLLTPGAFIMDTKGVIRFSYVNNNYSVRITQDKLLAAARDALKPQP